MQFFLGYFQSNQSFELLSVAGFERLFCKTFLSKNKKASKDQKMTFLSVLQNGSLSKIEMTKKNTGVGVLLQYNCQVTLLKRDATISIFRGIIRLSFRTTIYKAALNVGL